MIISFALSFSFFLNVISYQISLAEALNKNGTIITKNHTEKFVKDYKISGKVMYERDESKDQNLFGIKEKRTIANISNETKIGNVSSIFQKLKSISRDSNSSAQIIASEIRGSKNIKGNPAPSEHRHKAVQNSIKTNESDSNSKLQLTNGSGSHKGKFNKKEKISEAPITLQNLEKKLPETKSPFSKDITVDRNNSFDKITKYIKENEKTANNNGMTAELKAKMTKRTKSASISKKKKRQDSHEQSITQSSFALPRDRLWQGNEDIKDAANGTDRITAIENVSMISTGTNPHHEQIKSTPKTSFVSTVSTVQSTTTTSLAGTTNRPLSAGTLNPAATSTTPTVESSRLVPTRETAGRVAASHLLDGLRRLTTTEAATSRPPRDGAGSTTPPTVTESQSDITVTQKPDKTTTSDFGIIKYQNNTSKITNPPNDQKTHLENTNTTSTLLINLVLTTEVSDKEVDQIMDIYNKVATEKPIILSENATLNASAKILTEMPWPVKKEAVVEGDLVLGGLMMVHEREDSITCGPVMPQGGIQALEAMLYTLDRLNYAQDPLLPNITIGAHILDDCDKDTYGLEMAVDFIKGNIHKKKLNLHLAKVFCFECVPPTSNTDRQLFRSILGLISVGQLGVVEHTQNKGLPELICSVGKPTEARCKNTR